MNLDIIKKYNKAGVICFYIAMLIHLVVMCVELGAWDLPLRGRLLQVAFGLCCLKIITTHYEKKEWIAIALAAIVSIASYIGTQEKYVVYVAVLIIAAKSVDMEKIVRVMAWALTASIGIIAILSLVGIGGIVSETRDYGRYVVETRYYFGFSHANNLHGTFWYAIALLVYAYRDRFKWWVYALATVANIVLFMGTRSKAGVIVAQLMIVAGLVYKYWDRYTFKKLWAHILGVGTYISIVVLSIIAVSIDTLRREGILGKIDQMTTLRLSQSFENAYIGDWHLITPGGSRAKCIDNGFAYLGANYGGVILLAFVIFVAVVLYFVGKRRDGMLLAMTITGVMYTFMESSYMLNDAYMLSNIIFIVAMILIGGATTNNAENSL